MLQKLIITLVILGLFYAVYLYGTRNSEVDLTESMTEETPEVVTDHKAVTFILRGEPVTLDEGVATTRTGVVKYVGHELEHNMDDNGTEDVVFVVSEETSGGVVSHFAVAALAENDGGYKGSTAVLIGESVTPKLVAAEAGRDIVITYTAPYGVDEQLHLRFDPRTLEFGELVQDFEGESNQ